MALCPPTSLLCLPIADPSFNCCLPHCPPSVLSESSYCSTSWYALIFSVNFFTFLNILYMLDNVDFICHVPVILLPNAPRRRSGVQGLSLSFITLPEKTFLAPHILVAFVWIFSTVLFSLGSSSCLTKKIKSHNGFKD